MATKLMVRASERVLVNSQNLFRWSPIRSYSHAEVIKKFPVVCIPGKSSKKDLTAKVTVGYLGAMVKRTMSMQSIRNMSLLAGPEKISLLNVSPGNNSSLTSMQVRHLPTLNQIRKQKPRTKKKRPKLQIPKDKRILLGPQRKGVCVKLVVRTPKKPNSAQRKCAILRLSNGKLITAYIPGEKGVLQEHGVVLFEGGRVQDCPGIKYKIIRRKYDMN